MLREKQIVQTDKAPKPAGQYSQGVSAGNLIFVAGQVGIDPQTRIAPKGIAAQTKQCLENIKAILAAANTTKDGIIRIEVYLRNMEDFGEMNKVFEEYFAKFPPVRSTFQAGLAMDFLIEIDAIAPKS